MRKFLNSLSYLIFIFIFTILSFEVLIRLLPIYEKFGWQDKIPLFDRIDSLKMINDSKVDNVIIGDSLVEYMINQDENFIELTKKNLESKNIYQNFHNLGFAGTGIRDYLMILNLLISKKIEIDKLFIFIDNSTDFSGYFFDIESKKSYITDGSSPPVFNLDEENVNIKNLIKRLVSINIFYRYILKQYFKFDYSSAFNSNLSDLKLIFNLSEADINDRIKQIDKKLLHYSKSDIINAFWAAGAVAFPNMKIYEKYGYPVHGEKINQLILKDFNQINKICLDNNIDCSVIFIPDQTSVDREYQNLYRELGYNIDSNFLDGKNYYEDLIISDLKNENLKFHKLHGHLKSNENMYLFLDNHFNFHGNQIMSDLFTKILINNNL
jgi:hypothetical protein